MTTLSASSPDIPCAAYRPISSAERAPGCSESLRPQPSPIFGYHRPIGSKS